MRTTAKDDMTNAEAVFFWISVWIYGISFISFLYGLVFKKEVGVNAGWYLAIAGFCFQTVSMGLRWTATGHPPVMGTYENSMLGGWFIVSIFLVIRSWHKRLEIAGVGILPVVLLMMGRGIMGDHLLQPLSPPYRSNWLWLHVFFAWVAYGAFFIGAGLGAVYLLKERWINKGRKKGSVYERLPALDVFNDITLKVIIFGFIALTVEAGAGAIWAYGLWGRYWGWDPIETWSLITWLTYGTYIHIGVTLGWKGRRMAWLAILFLISEFVTFGGIGYFGGVHTPILSQ